MVVPLARHRTVSRACRCPALGHRPVARRRLSAEPVPAPPDARQAFIERHSGTLLDKLERESFPASGFVEGPGSFVAPGKAHRGVQAPGPVPDHRLHADAGRPDLDGMAASCACPARCLFGSRCWRYVFAGCGRCGNSARASPSATPPSCRCWRARRRCGARACSWSSRNGPRRSAPGSWTWPPTSCTGRRRAYRIHEVTPEDSAPGWESFLVPPAGAVRSLGPRSHAAGARARRVLGPRAAADHLQEPAHLGRSTGAVEMALDSATKVWVVPGHHAIGASRGAHPAPRPLRRADRACEPLLFNASLQHAIAAPRAYDKALAVLFIDLDRFKNINDTLGPRRRRRRAQDRGAAAGGESACLGHSRPPGR